MKRNILLLVLTLFLLGTQANAQTERQYNRVKERIQQELAIDEKKADSAAAILKRYFTAVRRIRDNEGLSDERKQLAIRKEKRIEVARLKSFLTENQLKQLRQMVQDYKEMRQQNNEEASDTSLSKYYF